MLVRSKFSAEDPIPSVLNGDLITGESEFRMCVSELW